MTPELEAAIRRARLWWETATPEEKEAMHQARLESIFRSGPDTEDATVQVVWTGGTPKRADGGIPYGDGASYLFATGDKDFLKAGDGDRRFAVVDPKHLLTMENQPVADQVMGRCSCGWTTKVSIHEIQIGGPTVKSIIWDRHVTHKRDTCCAEIASRVVPEYRPRVEDDDPLATTWQAAWDGACVALGGNPEEYRG